MTPKELVEYKRAVESRLESQISNACDLFHQETGFQINDISVYFIECTNLDGTKDHKIGSVEVSCIL